MGNPINQNKCSKTIFGPLLQTKYQYIVDGSLAPSITNCVTAVRYLLAKSSQQKLPPIFIGDMPRILMAQCGYAVQQIKISEMRCGDLIFFKWDSSNNTYFNERYICHIAIAMGPAMIFHSAQDRGGGSIENLARPVDLYAKTMLQNIIDQPFLFLRYIDPRNSNLRSKFGTEFLPFPIHKSLKALKVDEVKIQSFRPRSGCIGIL